MGKIKTKPWDAAEHLETEEDMALYLEAALEEGDPGLVVAALGDMARAKGMSEIASETGLGPDSLYKVLSPEGNPEFELTYKTPSGKVAIGSLPLPGVAPVLVSDF